MIIEPYNSGKMNITQSLIPVISSDGVLRGMVQIAPHTFTKTTELYTFGTRTLPVQAMRFSDLPRKIERLLMCLSFDASLSSGKDPWNGLPNFIAIADLGMMSIWAVPVMNPGYLRSTLGLADLFVSDRYDVKKLPSKDDSSATDELIEITIKTNVSISKFPQKFSFIECYWPTFIRDKVDFCTCAFHGIEVVQSDPSFKVMFYNKDTSSKVPDIMQIMLINVVNVGKVANFVFDIFGKVNVRLRMRMTVKP